VVNRDAKFTNFVEVCCYHFVNLSFLNQIWALLIGEIVKYFGMQYHFWFRFLYNQIRLFEIDYSRYNHCESVMYEWWICAATIFQFRTHKVIYRRYAGLFFSVCVDITDNELAYLESIHLFVEILDHFFSNVCELDLVFNFHKVLNLFTYSLSFVNSFWNCFFWILNFKLWC